MGLAENNLLIGLPTHVISHVEELCTFHNFSQNDLVTSRDQENKSLYFVIAGTYSVEISLSDDQELRYADVGQNDFFGEISAIDGLPRSADVRCRTSGQLAELGHADFAELLASEPDVTLRLLRLFTARLRQSNQRLQEFSVTPPANRIYEQILNLIKQDPNHPGQWIISPSPKHDEIAAWTGTSKSFVSETLGKLIHDHVVLRRNMDLIILDLYKLKNLSTTRT
jgi:CRP/FNR family cyclic AMP-dependent transcriptional regulator